MTFASSPRSLHTRNFSPSEIKNYLEKKSKFKLGPHYFHGVYLVNLASENKSLLKASINSLVFYQRLAADIGAVGTIFHVGSHKGRGFAETMNQIVASINYVLDCSPKGIKLILENAAGHSGTIGANFEEFSTILSRIGDKSKIGFCLDTQHAFASGVSLDKLLFEFDRVIGLKSLAVIHLNDSAVDFASKKDRHANLGEGNIGVENIKMFVNDSRLKNIPLILETPGTNHSGPRKQDLDLVKSFITP